MKENEKEVNRGMEGKKTKDIKREKEEGDKQREGNHQKKAT